MAPFRRGPPAAGRCRPNAPRGGAKIRRPVRSGPGPRQSSPLQASPRCHARHREDDAGYWFHEDQRTETSVRCESWSLLRPTWRVGAPPLECTNSDHVDGSDSVTALGRKRSSNTTAVEPRPSFLNVAKGLVQMLSLPTSASAWRSSARRSGGSSSSAAGPPRPTRSFGASRIRNRRRVDRRRRGGEDGVADLIPRC